MNGDDYGSVQHLYCRRSSDGSYRIDLDQSDGSARLIRVGADGTSTELVPWTESSAIKTGPDSNHVELICRGPSIELDSNGTKVFSARDTALEEGHGAVAVGGFPDADAIDEVRFANLVLVQR
jgi:hypothetical protein